MAAILPISEISTYHRNFTIRARVTNKSDMRTFNKGASQGKVFSCDLLDAEGGEIRASFFQPAADKYFPLLETGKCFTFSKGNIKVANKQFNMCKHRYELVFDDKAVVEAVADDASIKTVQINPVSLKKVQQMTAPCNVDLCGVVIAVKPFVAFTSKEGKELVKRDITLADDSSASIDVALWGERAKIEDSKFEGNPVISLKGVSIKEFQGGVSGSLMQAGALVFGIESADAKKIQLWWKEGGSTQTLTKLSAAPGGLAPARQGIQADLAQLRSAAENGSFPEQATLYTTVCRMALVQMRKQGEVQPLYYNACMEPKEGNGLPCNRRVDESGFCAACNRSGKIAPRFNLRCKFADHGESLFMTTFHEGACRAMGMSADEAKSIEKSEGGRETLEDRIRRQYFSEPLQLTVRAKMEMYQGEMRANTGCIDVRPVPYGQHGRAMLKEIQSMLAENPANL